MRRPLRSLPLVVAMLATLLVGCTRPPELIGIDNPEIPVASVADLTRHRIFITTTRQASEVARVRSFRPAVRRNSASLPSTSPSRRRMSPESSNAQVGCRPTRAPSSRWSIR
jgi:hypothetical protein